MHITMIVMDSGTCNWTPIPTNQPAILPHKYTVFLLYIFNMLASLTLNKTKNPTLHFNISTFQNQSLIDRINNRKLPMHIQLSSTRTHKHNVPCLRHTFLTYFFLFFGQFHYCTYCTNFTNTC